MWVLIADDDVLVARSTGAILSHAGYKVELAPDGRNALERLTQEHFDIFICDWLMPDVDGTAVVRALKATGKNTPAILLTSALHGPLPLQHAQRVGADGFLQKPASSQALLNAVRTALTKRQAARAATEQAAPAAPPTAASPDPKDAPAPMPAPAPAPMPAKLGTFGPRPLTSASKKPAAAPPAVAPTPTVASTLAQAAGAITTAAAAAQSATQEATDEPLAATERSPTWPSKVDPRP